MRTFYLAVLCTFIYTTSFSQTFKAKDLLALNLIPVRWQRYWNLHNTDSLATLFNDDVDFVNTSGVWMKGKVSAVNSLREKHTAKFKNSVWSTDSMRVKYLKANVAIMHVGWGLSGESDADGKILSPRHGIYTFVITKEDNQWLIEAIDGITIKEGYPQR